MDINLVTSAVAVKVKPGNLSQPGTFLSQRVAVLCEPNTANQPTLDTTPFTALSLEQVGDRLGVGSLGYLMYKNSLKYLTLPVVFYPQDYDTGTPPTATTNTVTVTGTATGNANHTLYINGIPYVYTILKGDTPTIIGGKIADKVNSVGASPVIAVNTTGTVVFTTKWKGATSAALKLRFVLGEKLADAVGVSYANIVVAGTGTPLIQDALDLFGSDHNTIVVNPYGAPVFDVLETFNGKPSETVQVGRWADLTSKPFLALCGSNASDAATVAALTDVDARKAQLTNVVCSSPNSEWFPAECAASHATLYAKVANDTPHKGICNVALPYNIAPVGGAGDFKDENGRNAIVKLGHCTSEYVNGEWVVRDFVTTYHPDGDDYPKYRFGRDVMVFMNLLFDLKRLQLSYYGSVTTDSATVTDVTGMVSVASVKTDVKDRIFALAKAGMIATPDFSFANATVSISPAKRINIAYPAQVTSEITQVDGEITVDFFITTN